MYTMQTEKNNVRYRLSYRGFDVPIERTLERVAIVAERAVIRPAARVFVDVLYLRTMCAQKSTLVVSLHT